MPPTYPKEQQEITTRESKVEIEKEIEVKKEIQIKEFTIMYPEKWHAFKFTDFPKKGSEPEIIDLAEVLNSDRAFNDFKGVFAPQLKVTRNFIKTVYEEAKPFEPGTQKRAYQVLAYIAENGELEMIMVDPWEAGLIREELAAAPKQAILIDLNTRFTQAFGQPIKDQKLLAELVVQAKFYSGYLIYSPDEYVYLKEWIQEKGIEKMKHLFDRIMLAHPGTEAEFQRSKLRSLLINIVYL